MQRRTGCAASLIVLVAGALTPWHDVSAQQSATTPPPPSQQESQTPLVRRIDISILPAEGRAEDRTGDLLFDATTSRPSDPFAWSMRARAQYKTPKWAFSTSLIGQRGSQLPAYLTETLDAHGRYAISSGGLRDLSGQHTWDVAFRVDRRLAVTRGGVTLDAFAQAFHPVGSNARRSSETPLACSSALSFGVVIGF